MIALLKQLNQIEAAVARWQRNATTWGKRNARAKALAGCRAIEKAVRAATGDVAGRPVPPCPLCKKPRRFKTFKALAKHLFSDHDCRMKNYGDGYQKVPWIPKCKCGKFFSGKGSKSKNRPNPKRLDPLVHFATHLVGLGDGLTTHFVIEEI